MARWICILFVAVAVSANITTSAHSQDGAAAASIGNSTKFSNLRQLFKNWQLKPSGERIDLLNDYLKKMNPYQVQSGVTTTQVKWPSTFPMLSHSPNCVQNAACIKCTTTAIGEYVVLTAAHCIGVTEGELIPGATAADPANVLSGCEAEPGFHMPANDAVSDPTEPEDIALCKSSQPFTGKLETLISAADMPKANDAVLMLGYGCRNASDEKDFGTLNYGNTTVRTAPDGNANRVYVLNPGMSGPYGVQALCSGDSGGAAYVFLQQSRRIFGVNVSGDNYFSKVAPIATPAFVSWALCWARRHDVTDICGLTPGALSASCQA